MQLQKYILETLSFFRSKYYLENNTALATSFENILTSWQEVMLLINAPELKKTLIKREMSKVINLLKEIKKSVTVSSDRRLLVSLIDLLINTRRETNKNVSYNSVFNSSVTDLPNVCKLTERNGRIFREARVITIRYPKNLKK